VPSMLISTHHWAILIFAIWLCLDLWLQSQWLPQFLVQKEPQERQRRFKSESQSSAWQLLQERQKMTIRLGRLVDGSMIAEFACREAQSKNTEVGMCLPCSSACIIEQFWSLPFDFVWIFDFNANDFHNFWFKRNHKKGREDLNREASLVPGKCYKKDKRWQSSWAGFWCLPDLERDMILPLCTRERNLVLGAT
jgi:hypothetical protein